MFVKQDDYTKRWHVYTAPHTQAIIDGKMRGYKTKNEADAAMAKAS